MAKGISGMGVGMMAAGGLAVYSAINNAGILESLRALARGQAPPKHPKEPYQPVELGSAVAAAGMNLATAVSNSSIVGIAMRHRGQHPYRYGAGHGRFACGSGQAQDCSGFASCVYHEAGLLDHPLNTTGFLMWQGMYTVPFENRTGGDAIIWPNHMGIIIDANQMIHTGGAAGCPCVVPYSQMRHGSKGIVRRLKGASGNLNVPAQKTR